VTLVERRKPHRKKLTRAGKLGDAGKHDEAEKLWREYLEKVPDDPDVLFNAGVCVMRRAQSPAERHEAAEFFHRVVQCADASMERKADAMNNLGLLMEKVGETEKAFTAYGFALKMFPEHKAALVNHADCLRFFGDYRAADDEYRHVINLDPESAEAHFCSGMVALLLGDYERGWKEYAWRFKTPHFSTKPFETDKPKWQGEPLAGKTLMIREEQGFGDSFQFLRYAAEFKFRHPESRIIFRCQQSLHRLAQGVIGLDGCELPDDPHTFDYWLSLMDSPLIAGTTLENIPPAECIRIRDDWPRWSMSATADKRRVALVWAGSPWHGKDRARSISAAQFQPVIDAHPECQFYSLQCGPKQPEVMELRDVIDLAPQVTNWTDSAQMLKCMDLLISVDTAVVHLAGAVGTPVYMLTPFSPDFRWMLQREDSVWYPKLRLFRQPNKDDWQTPLDRINATI